MFPFAIKEAPLRIPFAIKGAPLGFPSVSKRLHEGFLSVSKRLHQGFASVSKRLYKGFHSVLKRLYKVSIRYYSLYRGFLSVSKWPKKRFPRVCFCLIDFYSFRKVAGTLLYVFSEFASDTIKVESCLLKYSRTPDLTCLN